jgi:alpha-galactosidase
MKKNFLLALALLVAGGLSAQKSSQKAPDLSAYILTPVSAPTPRINGARVFGARPGADFLFSIAATGDRPMTFSAEGLPAGLSLDPATGRITGSVNATCASS